MNSELSRMMQEPLPSITDQKRLMYRPQIKFVVYVYGLLNDLIFENELTQPRIELLSNRPKYWGMCFGEYQSLRNSHSRCRINLMDKFYSQQWLITILAHEAAHQYQWDKFGPERENEGKSRLMSHGPSFFHFRDAMNSHGIPLKRSYRARKWFEHQNLMKC